MIMLVGGCYTALVYIYNEGKGAIIIFCFFPVTKTGKREGMEPSTISIVNKNDVMCCFIIAAHMVSYDNPRLTKLYTYYYDTIWSAMIMNNMNVEFYC